MFGCGKKPMRRLGLIGLPADPTPTAQAWRDIAEDAALAVCEAPEESLRRFVDLFPAGTKIEVFDDRRELVDRAHPEAVEITLPPAAQCGAVEFVAARRIPFMLQPPVTVNPDDVRAMAEAVLRYGAPSLVLDCLLFHPLVQKAKTLLDDGRIGEVQELYCKTHVGKGVPAGEASNYLDPAFNLSCANAFDRVALIERLLGPTAEVFGWAGKGCRMLSLKFQAPGRYGCREEVYSPDLLVPDGSGSPVDTLEITGTDGILWLRNLTGRLVESPKLTVKRKDETTSWDDEAGDALAAVARALRLRFTGRQCGDAPFYSVPDYARAVAVNLAAERSCREGKAVKVLGDYHLSVHSGAQRRHVSI